MRNISELRKKLGLSQRQFADKYHLSVRTLQQWEQGISKPLDSLLELIELDVNIADGLRKKYKHGKINKWKICIENPFLNCESVYPIQQRKIQALLDDLLDNYDVEKVLVFGSSVTDRCHIGSDVDIYVESNEEVKLDKVYNFEIDFWTNRTVDERLKKEIYSKGVVVYGKDQQSAR